MWHARPAGAARSTEAIARHVAECKVMYVEYAFGEGRLTWVDPEVRRWPADEGPMDEVLAWLGDSHATLMRHVRALSDEDLGRPRRANWGRDEETRWSCPRCSSSTTCTTPGRSTICEACFRAMTDGESSSSASADPARIRPSPWVSR